jgi:hypothetical protein
MCSGYNTARRTRWAWQPSWRVFGCIDLGTDVYRDEYRPYRRMYRFLCTRARARNYGFILVLCLVGIMFFPVLVFRQYIRV